MRKFLASVLIIIFLPTFVFILFLHATLSTFMDADFLKESLNKTNTYERVLGTAFPEIVDQFPKESEGLLSLINKDEAANLLTSTIKPGELQSMTESTIDNVIDFLNFKSERVELKYNFRKYKANFLANVKILLIKKFDSFPTCSPAQLESLGTNQEEITECLPSGQTGASIYNQLDLDKELTSGLESLPDELIVTKESILVKPKGSLDINPDESPLSDIETARNSISTLLNIALIGSISLAVMIILIIALRLPNWRSIFLWTGWTLLLGGLSATLPALILRVSPSLTAGIGKAAKVPEGISLLITDVLDGFTTHLTNQIFIISVSAFVIGIILITASVFVKREAQKPKNPKETNA